MFSVHVALVVLLPFQQDPSAALRTRLETLARSAIEDALLPGLAVQITTGEHALVSKGWGYAHSASGTTESPALARNFDAALEPLVAVALLQLADQKRVDLDEPISKHFPMLMPHARAVTIDQVLTHTSGLPDFRDWLRSKGEPRSAAAVVAWLGEQALDAEPGTCFAYSESNTLLAAMLLEKVAARPLADTLAVQILERAGLEHTAFREVVASEASLAPPGARVDDPTANAALGLRPLVSTLQDMTRFVGALRHGDLLGERGWRHLSEPVHVRGEEVPLAYGFARGRIGHAKSFSFGGSCATASTFVSWYPEMDLVIALGTTSEASTLPAIELRLARALLDAPEPEVVDLATTPEQRAAYLGAYYLGCTRVEIVERGEQLFFASPFEETFRLRFQGGHRFVSERDAEVQLEFRLDGSRATEFVITQHGTQSTAKRLE